MDSALNFGRSKLNLTLIARFVGSIPKSRIYRHMKNHQPPDKLSIIVYDGHFDKVHFALILASGASAIGQPTTVFFTMGACQILLHSNHDGVPGWAKMPLSNNDGLALEQDQFYEKSGIATAEELLTACKTFKVKFLVCEMGLRAMNLDHSDLRSDLNIEIGGVVTFLSDASKDGAMLFI